MLSGKFINFQTFSKTYPEDLINMSETKKLSALEKYANSLNNVFLNTSYHAVRVIDDELEITMT